jgi:hypothetical protein
MIYSKLFFTITGILAFVIFVPYLFCRIFIEITKQMIKGIKYEYRTNVNNTKC